VATDSEHMIRRRQPLSVYWHETIEAELARSRGQGEAGANASSALGRPALTDVVNDLAKLSQELLCVVSGLLPAHQSINHLHLRNRPGTSMLRRLQGRSEFRSIVAIGEVVQDREIRC
jgi:hypothetical protein